MTSGSETRRIRAALIGLALLFGTLPALAAPSTVERETARALLLSGREKMTQGQERDALADFERAHAIMHVPTTALDLGRAQQSLGMLVEARTTFLEGARHPESASDPPAFSRARAEAKQLAAAIASRLATLTILTNDEVRVTLDGVALSTSSVGIPLKVNPGRHDIIASRGSEQKRASVDLAEASVESIDVTFTAPPATTTPSPTAKPSVDERSTRAPLPSEPRTSPFVWIGLGTAIVAGGVGATTGLFAFDAKSDVAARCDGGVRCPPSTYDDIDRGETLGTVSTVAFAVAGAAVVVMVIGLLTSTQTPAAPAPGLVSQF